MDREDPPTASPRCRTTACRALRRSPPDPHDPADRPSPQRLTSTTTLPPIHVHCKEFQLTLKGFRDRVPLPLPLRATTGGTQRPSLPSRRPLRGTEGSLERIKSSKRGRVLPLSRSARSGRPNRPRYYQQG